MRWVIGGAAFLALMGGYWCLTALSFWSGRPGWAIAVACAVVILLLAGCVVRWLQAAKLPRGGEADAAQGKRMGMWFGIIFGIEGGMIGVIAPLLARTGHSEWILMAIALIVGVHFLPLAYVFEVPQYYLLGGLCVVGSLGCFLIPPMEPRNLCVGFVMAFALWLTSLLLVIYTKPVQVAD